jgi:hypothetical protein
LEEGRGREEWLVEGECGGGRGWGGWWRGRGGGGWLEEGRGREEWLVEGECGGGKREGEGRR